MCPPRLVCDLVQELTAGVVSFALLWRTIVSSKYSRLTFGAFLSVVSEVAASSQQRIYNTVLIVEAEIAASAVHNLG
jgi:hypothetical protein